MKSSIFDLEELNCWNKNLDIDLDASERNLDSFLHETWLLAKFRCHLWKILSPSYDIGLGWNLERLYSFESWIEKKLRLHQLDYCSSRYSSWNSRKSTLADYEIWLWRLRFPYSSLFYFLALDFQKGMDVSFLMPLESLHFNLQSSRSAQNIDWRSNLPIISNLLLFASFIQKCLQNIKQIISMHFIYKT
jgi:hypothetical protein